MPRVVIDDREVEVPPDSTILDAARRLGVEIPTLCFLDGHPPRTSCMVCQVKLADGNRMVPACATIVEEGMRIESETDEVRRIRRTCLELILSDHTGDCTAPCQNACPTHMNIPLMLRQVAKGRLEEAIATIRKDMALPAVLGRVCPEVCERGCRRRELDSSVAICLIKRYVADVDLASKTPYLPPRKKDSGKSVGVIGAGPAGLSAAYHLLQMGHACTLLDDQPEPGGMLRREFDDDQLPRKVLEAEIAVIDRLGARFEPGVSIGRDRSLADLRQDFDAVLVAVGRLDETGAGALGLDASQGRLLANRRTHETSVPGVFAAGDALQPAKLVVRSVADGKAAAHCIDQYLGGTNVTGLPKEFTVRTGRLNKEQVEQLLRRVGRADRTTPAGGNSLGYTGEEARFEASRCLHCDCSRQDDCKLRSYARIYGATANRYAGTRRNLTAREAGNESAPSSARTDTNIVYDPGKCILCGLCIQVAEQAGEPLGLTFVGRGFDVRVGVPFDRSIAEGLQLAARRCVEVCPTGALSYGLQQCICACSTDGHQDTCG